MRSVRQQEWTGTDINCPKRIRLTIAEYEVSSEASCGLILKQDGASAVSSDSGLVGGNSAERLFVRGRIPVGNLQGCKNAIDLVIYCFGDKLNIHSDPAAGYAEIAGRQIDGVSASNLSKVFAKRENLHR